MSTVQPRRDLTPVDTSWRLRGACTKADPELFFHPEGERDAPKRRRITEAKAVCRACPVMTLCREDAIAKGEEFGIRGGLSESERASVRLGKPLELAPELRIVPTVVTAEHAGCIRPEPVTKHLKELVGAGFTLGDIAQYSGISVYGIKMLLKGARQRVYATTAQRLLSVQVWTEAA